jgi:hypothetical protein
VSLVSLPIFDREKFEVGGSDIMWQRKPPLESLLLGLQAFYG